VTVVHYTHADKGSSSIKIILELEEKVKKQKTNKHCILFKNLSSPVLAKEIFVLGDSKINFDASNDLSKFHKAVTGGR